MNESVIETLKNSTHATVKEFRKIIKMNIRKLPNHYRYMYEEFDEDYYNINPHEKYVDLLIKFGKFINKYNIDINFIKKPILNEINERYRIRYRLMH